MVAVRFHWINTRDKILVSGYCANLYCVVVFDQIDICKSCQCWAFRLYMTWVSNFLCFIQNTLKPTYRGNNVHSSPCQRSNKFSAIDTVHILEGDLTCDTFFGGGTSAGDTLSIGSRTQMEAPHWPIKIRRDSVSMVAWPERISHSHKSTRKWCWVGYYGRIIAFGIKYHNLVHYSYQILFIHQVPLGECC